MRTRFIHEVGTSAVLRVYWDDYIDKHKGRDACPNSYGLGKPGIHNAEMFLTKTANLSDWDLGGLPRDYAPDRWPAKCDHCPAVVPAGIEADGYPDGPGLMIHHQIFRKRLYNTASGQPEPGDLFWVEWYHREHGCLWWDNCSGPHLMAICPNGDQWDIDSRASNCTMNEDRKHRCWIRHGRPEDGTIHVDKNGLTCAAGGGSIQTSGYHGFLHNGNFS